MSLREGCNVILKTDCVALLQRLDKGQRRGMQVANSTLCETCGNPILLGKDTTNCVVFFCRHVYHTKCLKMGIEAVEKAQEQVQPNKKVKANPLRRKKESEESSIWCTKCQTERQLQQLKRRVKRKR